MATLHFTPVHETSEVFSISNQALKLTTTEDIEPHLKELEKFSKVTKLDVSGNTIGIEASRSLAEFIQSHPSVKNNLIEINFADLYTSRLVDEVVESLNIFVPVLLECQNLSIVNLSDNAFGLRTIDSLEHYIANAVQLQHLILSNNGMGPFAGERIGKALFRLAQQKKKQKKPFLETFICGRNRLENGSAPLLAVGLKAHADGLKVVKLYQNGIRPSGVAILIRYGFSFNPNLEILDLQDNTFTTGASTVLADALPVWKETLLELNLNDCLLKGSGSDAVCKVFNETAFKELRVLRLQYNELTQDTLLSEIMPALENGNLPSLRLLELNGNRLEEGSDALTDLEQLFEGELDELDDLEEVDSDESEEEEEEAQETEKLVEIDIAALEKTLSELRVDEITEELEKTHI
ncbi:LAMI_0C05270g1_1 [Lachancea mirantina]|uniref:LAMI_0C05270g1_1 n=1 Tax=Lachancea mirantina TaxID=1230905 RepID=A0A1G4J2J5_9SACH|nr:LAMI_0C05270g1_1 [Lachancea mirantina]